MRAVRILREAAQEAVDLLEGRVIPLLPLSGLATKHRLMRLVLRRFPYSVVVLDRDDETLVVAIAHQSRRPGYWRNRPTTSQVQDAAA